MFQIGCHLSSSKGYLAMGKDAVKPERQYLSIFQPEIREAVRQKPLTSKMWLHFSPLQEGHGIHSILAHAPYTLNACSKDERTREFALETMTDDLRRMEYTPNQLYNFHPGSHVGQGVETGITQIAALLNTVLTEGQTTTVLLETMAGKGTEIGRSFEELREILDRVTLSDKMGVCFLDTCHVYDAGYDIVNDLDGVLTQFDKVIGLDKLKAIHLNDSMNPINSHKDRHQKIGDELFGLSGSHHTHYQSSGIARFALQLGNPK